MYDELEKMKDGALHGDENHSEDRSHEEDDQNEKNRKIAAQQAVLPCSGPKPRW